ncbi:MAG: MFS transporter [Armatimonadota bacterium]
MPSESPSTEEPATVPSPAEVLSPAARRRTQDAIVKVAMTSTIIATILNVAALFLLHLGASAFQVGLLTTLMALGSLAQLGGVVLMPHIGKVPIYRLGRYLSLVGFAGLIILACSGWRGQGAVWLALGFFTLRMAMNAMGETAWWPLLQDATTGDAIGQFFARMRARLRATDIAMPLLVGVILGAHPAGWRFAFIFGMAALAVVAGAQLIRGAAESPLPPQTETLPARLVNLWRIREVRRFLLFLAVRTIVIAAGTPFWVVMLKERGVTDDFVVWLTAIAAFGNILGLQQWGRAVDHYGSRPIIAITLLPECLLGVAWFFLPESVGPLRIWAGVLYLLWGACEGGFLLGYTRAMLNAIPRERQGEGFAALSYTAAIAGALGGVLGGLGFGWALAHQSGVMPLAYLAGIQFLLVFVWLLSRRLT